MDKKYKPPFSTIRNVSQAVNKELDYSDVERLRLAVGGRLNLAI